MGIFLNLVIFAIFIDFEFFAILILDLKQFCCVNSKAPYPTLIDGTHPTRQRKERDYIGGLSKFKNAIRYEKHLGNLFAGWKILRGCFGKYMIG